jgi:hypothetical protein
MTRLRATGVDEYGNAAESWDTPDTKTIRAFVTYGAGSTLGHAHRLTKALFPVGTDVQDGDRVVYLGATYVVEAARSVRSPSKPILVAANLAPVVT